MSSPSGGPRCPRCRRAIAAWRLNHCVYCGEVFPPDLREGHEEPEALKWADRPTVPPDAMRQLELMKVVPFDKPARPRNLMLAAAFLSLPIFAGIFFMIYRLIMRYSPAGAVLVAVGGVGFLVYLVWSALRASRSR